MRAQNAAIIAAYCFSRHAIGASYCAFHYYFYAMLLAIFIFDCRSFIPPYRRSRWGSII